MTLPMLGKIFSLLAIMISLVVMFFFTSCGTTHAVVRTKDSGQATITITTNNPLDISTTPNIDVKLNDNNKNN